MEKADVLVSRWLLQASVRCEKTDQDKKNGQASVELSYTSKDGEEGYPGDLVVNATFTLTDNNEFKMDFKATTDKPTIINLCNHGYWNLSGKPSATILKHILQLNADRFTPVDSTLIPTGALESVSGTPLDFTKKEVIGKRIGEFSDPKYKHFNGGYDHNFVLNKKDQSLTFAAHLEDPSSGRTMEVWTTAPGIQCYTGNFLDGSVKGKGEAFGKHAAVCLETQNFPDAPNKPSFPSPVLKPNEVYSHTVVHKFGVSLPQAKL